MKILSRHTDALVAALFFLAAFAIRWLNFNLIPSYSDEAFEVLWGYDIAQGKHFPLYGYPPHYGPLFAYLIALTFRIFGTSIEMPRLLIVFFGAATVPVTYALVRVMRDKTTALVAGALTLTCPLLVIMASHQGWSSGLTPFFTTITALMLYLAATTQRKILYALGGFFAGLTLQTHATTGAALIGMAIWLLCRPDPKQWLVPFAIALGFFLLGYAPMIIANVGGASPLWQAANDHAYVFAPTLDPGEYLSREIFLFKSFGYYIGQAFGEPTPFLRAQAIGFQIFFLAALLWAISQRHWLMPFTILGMFLILPLVAVPENYRYSMNLIPMTHALSASFLVALGRTLAAKISNPNLWLPKRLSAVALSMIFILNPLATIQNYYQDVSARGMTNANYFALAQTIRAQNACGARLFVDDRSITLVLSDGVNGYNLWNVDYLLTLEGCAHTFANISAITTALAASPESAWIISPATEIDGVSLDPNEPKYILNFDEGFAPVYLYRVKQ